ncbi:hypothetical protein JCM11251_007545 [Rhodosporidiobolus azoricus]
MPPTDWEPPAPFKPAPSLSPSRTRRLTFRVLNPFRRDRDRRDSDLTPLHPIPLDPPPLEEEPPKPARRTSTSIFSKKSSLFSKKLRTRTLVKLGVGKASKEEADQKERQKEREEEERRAREEEYQRNMVHWQKRTANQPLPTEAAAIRAAWVREQIINQPAPTISVEIDPRASISSVGSLLFPASTPGQTLSVFNAPPPRSASQAGGPALDYATAYPPSTASSASRDDIVRSMAKPFPSRPASSQAGEVRRTSLSLTSPTPEEETLPFAFPLPPARQSDLDTPPASPYGSLSPLHKELVNKPVQLQTVPFDTPPHTPRRLSYLDGSDRRSSPPSRRSSIVVSTDFASANRDANGRPLSLTIPPSSSTVPIFTRGTSPFARLTGHQRSASAALPATGTASPTNPRRPVSIAPQLGGRRMSSSLASSGAFGGAGTPNGVNRQSWASVQSQASSVGSSASTNAGGKGLIEEIRRKAEERERGTSKGHRRGDSNATVMQEKEGGKWQPVEADLAEKENIPLAGEPYLGDVDVVEEVGIFAYEAEEMFSDERLQALVRELGI